MRVVMQTHTDFRSKGQFKVMKVCSYVLYAECEMCICNALDDPMTLTFDPNQQDKHTCDPRRDAGKNSIYVNGGFLFDVSNRTVRWP